MESFELARLPVVLCDRARLDWLWLRRDLALLCDRPRDLPDLPEKVDSWPSAPSMLGVLAPGFVPSSVGGSGGPAFSSSLPPASRPSRLLTGAVDWEDDRLPRYVVMEDRKTE